MTPDAARLEVIEAFLADHPGAKALPLAIEGDRIVTLIDEYPEGSMEWLAGFARRQVARVRALEGEVKTQKLVHGDGVRIMDRLIKERDQVQQAHRLAMSTVTKLRAELAESDGWGSKRENERDALRAVAVTILAERNPPKEPQQMQALVDLVNAMAETAQAGTVAEAGRENAKNLIGERPKPDREPCGVPNCKFHKPAPACLGVWVTIDRGEGSSNEYRDEHHCHACPSRRRE